MCIGRRDAVAGYLPPLVLLALICVSIGVFVALLSQKQAFR